ncbi:hypothetical protein G6F70_004959 [Rhizopus microsporus]|uniref:Nudix hydrolase 15, mitochondrial n=2 Tax=Rhizopus TaxID=4842 RepID=A0A367K6T4_RHIAZ|nr:hypothetical protein G6F71_001217 [Rhizopus microsporus]RCH97875.1 Nudix hydrolase 15, mitochondrial [Rhizopus azygosporus]KAG1199412.1 hypothetical protein G6F70_004959 [Rhizopus microsporus]KAG1207505.1 hypothetical protein G6F69_007997 [Rhizopus microsporus]KAG1233089.1 hypothetical protein G6F67_004533 [Rhizopus microsporus]
MTQVPQQEVRVGVACFVVHRPSDGILRILISQRKGSHGAGTWQLPGGHMEMFESFEGCARREVLEETNLEINSIRFVTATNNIMGDKHYVTIFMYSEVSSEEIKNLRVMEPEKLQGEWKWVTLDELVTYKPLFSPLQSFIDQQDTSFLK